MMVNIRPKIIEEKMAKYSAGAVVFLIMGMVQWVVQHSFYAVLPGVFMALILIGLRERFRRRIQREGFCWKQYKVIEHTYLLRWHKKPTGFVALSFNEGEPVKRYHFALTNRIETPEIGMMLNICIPGDVRIEEIGRTSYVYECFGIMHDGHAL